MVEMSLLEMRNLLDGAAEENLVTEIKKKGKTYFIPSELMAAFLKFVINTEGTIDRDYQEEKPFADGGSTTGAGGHIETVGSNGVGIYEITDIFVAWAMAVFAADRTVSLKLSSAGQWTNDVRGISQESEIYFADTLTLSSGQSGFIWLSAPSGYGQGTKDDNGSLTPLTSPDNPLPMKVIGGFKINADIGANGQAGDQSSVDYIARRIA